MRRKPRMLLYLPVGIVPCMAKGSKDRIVEAGLALAASGAPVTLESAAREAGLTKPGLMYHFPTKQALMLGLVDHVIDHWQRRLQQEIGQPPEAVTTAERIRAYLNCVLSDELDRTDVVMCTDVRYSELMTARWVERMQPWLGISENLDAVAQGNLLTARLVADGVWYSTAFCTFPLDTAATESVRATAMALLADT